MFLDTLMHLIIEEGVNIPKAQVERYISPILSIFLPDILNAVFGHQYTLIVPEFPIRKGTLNPEEPSNQSTNIDYLMWNLTCNTLTFVELKTDSSSFKLSQLYIYEKLEALSKVSPTPFGSVLYEDLIKIKKASSYKAKYQYVIEQKWDEHLNQIDQIEVIYLVPAQTKLKEKLPDLYTLYFADLPLEVRRFNEEYQVIRSYLIQLDQN